MKCVISCLYLQNHVCIRIKMINSSLYIFNPDNDLALANGVENYMAPASARQMAGELALLPAWYALPGSAILAPSAYNQDFLLRQQQIFPLPVTLMTEPEIQSASPGVTPIPWGWNLALRKRLLVSGVSESVLPTVGDIERLRNLSHRSQAVGLLPALQLNDFFCGESYYLTEENACRRFVESRETCLLKAPWSGSGKGLNWCKGVFTPHIFGWCARVSASQGGVVGEPLYNKVEDFAMEFRTDGRGGVYFVGYSLFHTGSNGAYEGNLLLADEEIESRLSRYVPIGELWRLKTTLAQELSARIGKEYNGYLGVDMMICRFASAPVYRIHPCVEINLRMNMGLVTRLLYDRYVKPGASGIFRMSYLPEPGAALREQERLQTEYPLQIEDGRVVAGYLPLVPVTKRNNYWAWIQV